MLLALMEQLLWSCLSLSYEFISQGEGVSSSPAYSNIHIPMLPEFIYKWQLRNSRQFMYACVYACEPKSCLTICDPKDCSLPGSSVHGILQARILEWVALPSSGGSSQPRDRTHVSYVSCIGRLVLYRYHHLGRPQIICSRIVIIVFICTARKLGGEMQIPVNNNNNKNR